jgi:hypothetical protein
VFICKLTTYQTTIDCVRSKFHWSDDNFGIVSCWSWDLIFLDHMNKKLFDSVGVTSGIFRQTHLSWFLHRMYVWSECWHSALIRQHEQFKDRGEGNMASCSDGILSNHITFNRRRWKSTVSVEQIVARREKDFPITLRSKEEWDSGDIMRSDLNPERGGCLLLRWGDSLNTCSQQTI